MVRKTITSGLLLAFCMLCILPPATVQAQPAISAQKATEIAKSIITLPEDIKNFRSNYSEYQGRGTWELNWETANGNISVNVDAVNGEINQFYQYDDLLNETSLLPSVSKEAAIKKANEFLARAVPSKYQFLKYMAQDNYEITRYNQNYTITYQRIVNNIPYLQNFAYINVSSQTGEIINYNLNWDYNMTFPATTGIIANEKATQVLKDNAFELMYYLPYDSKNNKVFLVYGVENPGNVAVDAHTGKYCQISVNYRVAKDMAMAKDIGGLGGGS